MPTIVETERKMRNRGHWLCRAGWALFAISLALPSVHVFSWDTGWESFRMVFSGLWESFTKPPQDVYSFYLIGFALVNTVFLASPLLIRLHRGDLRRLRRVAFMVGGATVYVASFLVWGGFPLADIHVGYYAWLLSFGLVTAGALHLSMRRSKAIAGQLPTSTVRTVEEVRALRELEDYLRSVDRPNVTTPACVRMN